MQPASSFYAAVFDVIQIIRCGLEQCWRFFIEDVFVTCSERVVAPGW